MNTEITFPSGKIDLPLLLNQKEQLINLRSKYPNSSDVFKLFSGIIHLMDFIGDQIEEAISEQLVCIVDYDNWTSRFIQSIGDCPVEYREIYQTTINLNDYIKMGCMDAIPAPLFTEDQWVQFKRHGLNCDFAI